MKKITLMLFMVLLSMCSYAQLVQEEFETWPVPEWQSYQNGVGSTTWIQGQPNTPIAGVNNTKSASIASQNVPPPGAPIDYLRTKKFTVPDNPELHFMSVFVIAGNYGNTVDVMIVKADDNATGDPTIPNSNYVSLIDDNGWTELEINPVQTTYTAKKLPIPAEYVGEEVYIVFVYKSVNSTAGTERWAIDNVRVETKCVEPTFTVTNPTTTTVQINITNGQPTWEYEVDVVLAAGAPDFIYEHSWTGTTFTVPNLLESTDYKFYVRRKCSPTSYSEPTGPIARSTVPRGSTCAEPKVITALPYQTTDNTVSYGDDIEGAPGTSGCGTTGGFLNGNEVVYSFTPTFTGDVSIAMTNNGQGSGMFIYTSCENIGVTCAAGGTGSATTPVTIPNFAVTANQTYYIVISTSGTIVSTPYTLTVQPASCPAPTNLGATAIGSDTATLTWTNPTSSEWQYVVQPAGTGIPTPATATQTAAGNSWPVSPLNQATNYEYYVRANCNNGTYSAWAGPFLFMTTQVPADLPYTEGFESPSNWTLRNGTQVNKWAIGSATNNGGTQSLYISNTNGATNAYEDDDAPSVVQAYRDIAIPAGANEVQLTFDWKGQGEGPAIDFFKVFTVPTTYIPNPGTATTANAGAGRVQVGGTFNQQANWTTATYTVDVSQYDGQTRRLLFEWKNDEDTGTQPPAAIDNINISVISCSVPRTLAVTANSITQNSAVITWNTPLYGTPNYDYYYSTSDTPPTASTTPSQSNVSGTTATLTPLQSATVYYVWVRSNCGADGVSTWVGPVRLNTLQVPATTNYTETFEGATEWTFINGTQTNQWIIGSATNNGGAKSLYVSNDNTANAYTVTSSSVVHAYRDIQMPGNPLEQITISFDWKAMGEPNNINDRLRVYLVPVAFNPTPGTQITGSTQNVVVGLANYNQSTAWQNSFTVLPAGAYAGQVRRLVFEWRNDGAAGQQPPAAVDNINVSVVTCPSPTNLVAGAITPTSAIVNWTAPVTVTPTYDFYVSTRITDVPGATTTPTGNVPTATVTLDDEIPAGSTNFYVWVRSRCSDSDQSYWIGPLQVGLPQVPAALNIQDNLEGPIGWTIINGNQTNKWVVGNAVSSSPTTSMYISNNNGLANNYTTTSTTTTHIYRDFVIPAGATDIAVSFDWKAMGEGADDRLRVWVVPASFTPTAGTQIGTGTGRTRVGGDFSGSNTWATETFVIPEGAYVGQTRRLIFEWRNDASDGAQSAAAIDNINVKVVTCPAVTNLQANGTGTIGDVTLSWTPVGTETKWEIVIQPDTDGPPGQNPTVITVENTPSHTITIPAGEFKEFYVRPVCSDSDKGLWAGPLAFSVFAPPACAKIDLYDEDLQVVAPGTNFSICPGEDACVELNAQFLQTGNTTSYQVQPIDYTPQFPFTGGIELNISQDDQWGPAFNFPADFNFCFFGQKQNKAQVGSNGVVTFDTYATGSTCNWSFSTPIPDTGFPIKNAIYGVYQDIFPPTDNAFANPSINYQILGTYPCRAFVVNFNEVAQFSCNNDANVGAQTSQIVFYEITNIIEVYVKRRVPCNTWQSGRGVIGVQNAAGTVAFTPPGRNTGNWTAIEEAYRFVPNGPSNTVFEWFKDGQLFSNNPTVEVCVTDVTNMVARATYTGCGNSTPTVIESTVTITPEQPIIVTQTTPLKACVPNPGDNATFNLMDGVQNAIANPQNYTFTFYETEALAIEGNPANELPLSYVTNATKTIFVRVQLTGRTCFATDSFTVTVEQGPLFDLPADFAVCTGVPATIAVSNANFDVNDPAVTYSWTLNTNPLPDTGSSIAVTGAGTYEVTVTKGACSKIESVDVTITTSPPVDQLADVVVCELNPYQLPVLTPGNKYYTQSGGGGTQLAEGSYVTTSQTIYVRVEGATPGCNSEDSFTVTVVPRPVLNVPSDAIVCVADNYTLPALAVGNYYDAPGGTGSMLPVGHPVTATQTIYVYAVSATPTTPACTSEGSFTITVVPQITADVLPSVPACESFQLPALNPNNTYYTGPDATGTQLNQGSFITETQTIYIYAESGSCNDESSFTVTIVPEPLPVTISEGCDGGRYMLNVVFNGAETNYNSSNVTFAWSTSPGGAVIGTEQSLHAQSIGTYYVTVTPAGSTVSCSQMEDTTVTDITCMIQRGISPNGDGLNDSFDLSSFNVSKLSIFNRYGREVYSYSNYTDQWHGQSDGGSELPTGTYFYSMKRQNGEQLTGWIYVNREEK